MIDIGSPAPDFTLPRDGGGTVTLSDLRPGPVVLYFYPRDSTKGCTLQALDFSAHLLAFEASGATVLGVSKDTVASHDKFRDKQGLGVTLLSDADSNVCENYGVLAEKKMYGKTHMGIVRSTFLIDGEGRIAQAWRKVRVPGHVDAVLEAARNLR